MMRAARCLYHKAYAATHSLQMDQRRCSHAAFRPSPVLFPPSSPVELAFAITEPGATVVLARHRAEYKGLLATADLSSPNIACSDCGFSESVALEIRPARSIQLVGVSITSIDRPDTGGGDFNEVSVRISKIDALATQLPRTLLFNRDSVFCQPCFPSPQLRSRNCESDMQLSVSVVRRLDRARTALFE
jgi:hypothetical protein